MAKRKTSKFAQSRLPKHPRSQAGQSRAHISGLPAEILLRIFGFIPPSEGRPFHHRFNPLATWGVPRRAATRDYLSLALTCRAFTPAATSLLYQKYDHNWDHKTSTPFIERLIAKPELAALVKDVKEVGSIRYHIGTHHSVELRNRNAPSVEAMTSAITRLDIPQANAYNALFQNDQDLYTSLETALLVFLTPNVEKLSLNCCPGLQKAFRARGDRRWALRQPQAALLPLLYAARGIPYGQVHSFKNLRRLKLNMLGFHINTISSVLKLESLRDLVLFDYCNHGFGLDDTGSSWDCAPKTSNVQNIRLDDFDCHLGSLNNLFQSCRALTSFAITTPYSQGPPWQWSEVRNLLLMHHPGLEALKIKDMRDRAAALVRLGSLREFANLKYLATSLELLVGKFIPSCVLHWF